MVGVRGAQSILDWQLQGQGAGFPGFLLVMPRHPALVTQRMSTQARASSPFIGVLPAGMRGAPCPPVR